MEVFSRMLVLKSVYSNKPLLLVSERVEAYIERWEESEPVCCPHSQGKDSFLAVSEGRLFEDWPKVEYRTEYLLPPHHRHPQLPPNTLKLFGQAGPFLN